jgi:hypothetical protein
VFKKVIVVRFFWSNDGDLNKISFDTMSKYTAWKREQGKSIEIISEKDEVEYI